MEEPAAQHGSILPQWLQEHLPWIQTEVHKVAKRCLRDRHPDGNIRATSIEDEAWVRFLNLRDVDWDGKEHVVRVFACFVKWALSDRIKREFAAKRGGEWKRIDLTEDVCVEGSDQEEVLAFGELMDELLLRDPRVARVVILHELEGLSQEETAQALGIRPRTVREDLRRFKESWLEGQSEGQSNEQ